MNWLLPALIAPAFSTVTIFIDKYLLEKEIKDYLGLPIFTGIVGFTFGVIFWLVGGMPILGLRDTCLIIASGMLSVWHIAAYYNALRVTQASLVNLFLQIIPVFILILSFLFLQSGISGTQFLGFVLILVSSILGSVEGNIKQFRISKSIRWIILACFFYAVSAVLIKFTLEANTFIKIITYEGFGVGIGGLILFLMFYRIRDAFFKDVKNVRKRALGLVFVNESIYVVAKALSYFAFSLGPVALVSIVGGTQAIYGILYGWILTIFFPHIFKEDISRSGLVKKLIMTILILGGLFLVNN